MILTPYDGKLLVVMQPDHGIQTGLFAAAWGNDEIPPPASDVAAVRLAATHHDDGWATWERRPSIDPGTGLPVQFVDLKPREHLPLYRYGIDRAADHDPRTGLLVSMHGAGLYNDRYGTFRLAEQHFTPDEQRLVDEFLADMAAMQTRLAGTAWSAAKADVRSPHAAAGHTHISDDPLVRYEYLLLQIWDRLSLQYVYRLAGDGTLAPLPQPDGSSREIVCRNRGPNHLSLDPYPFLENDMTFPVRSVTIRHRPYKTPEDFLEEVAGAALSEIECRASRA